MRSYIISISNQKGGVGKTTTSFQVSIYLASAGRKTLFIDTDPQGNLTKSLIDSDEPGVYEALILRAFFFFGPPGGEFPAKSRFLVTYRVGRAHVDSPISLSPGSASVRQPDRMRTTLLLLPENIFSILLRRKTPVESA
jgi:hypothetical protein